MGNTLEQLENDAWPDPDFPSYLVTTCHRLRRKSLDEFTTEDLLIMIGQNIGLKHVAPIAITRLKENPLAEGDFFEDDLLLNVTRMERSFLSAHPHLSKEIGTICKAALRQLRSSNNSDKLDRELIQTFSNFVEEFS